MYEHFDSGSTLLAQNYYIKKYRNRKIQSEKRQKVSPFSDPPFESLTFFKNKKDHRKGDLFCFGKGAQIRTPLKFCPICSNHYMF